MVVPPIIPGDTQVGRTHRAYQQDLQLVVWSDIPYPPLPLSWDDPQRDRQPEHQGYPVRAGMTHSRERTAPTRLSCKLVADRLSVNVMDTHYTMSTKDCSKSGSSGLQSRRSFFGIAAGGGAATLLAGCDLPVRGTAVPMGRTLEASVLGIPNERFFPLYGTEPLEVEFAAAADRLRKSHGLAANAPLPECSCWRCPAAVRMAPRLSGLCAAGPSTALAGIRAGDRRQHRRSPPLRLSRLRLRSATARRYTELKSSSVFSSVASPPHCSMTRSATIRHCSRPSPAT
jgi:hypothetical protein